MTQLPLLTFMHLLWWQIWKRNFDLSLFESFQLRKHLQHFLSFSNILSVENLNKTKIKHLLPTSLLLNRFFFLKNHIYLPLCPIHGPSTAFIPMPLYFSICSNLCSCFCGWHETYGLPFSHVYCFIQHFMPLTLYYIHLCIFVGTFSSIYYSRSWPLCIAFVIHIENGITK